VTTAPLTHRPPAAANALFAAVAGHLFLFGFLMTVLPGPRAPVLESDRILQLVPLRAAPALSDTAPTPSSSALIDRTAAPRAAPSAARPVASRAASPRPAEATRAVAAPPAPPAAAEAVAAAPVAVAPDSPANPAASGDEAEARARAADATREQEAAERRLREDLQRRVRHDFARHFRYPPLARRHGWEGAVRLRYDVTPQGQVINVRLLASSGHPALDRDAEQTLSGLAPLAAAAWAEPVEALELAVHYRLTEG